MHGEGHLIMLSKVLLGRQPKHCDVLFNFFIFFLLIFSLVLFDIVISNLILFGVFPFNLQIFGSPQFGSLSRSWLIEELRGRKAKKKGN